MSEAYFEEDFARDDNTEIGNGWTTNGGGNPQIINQAVRQGSSGAASQVAVFRTVASAASEIGNEYAIQAVLACDDDTAARAANIVMRGDIGNNDGYLVRLTWETDTLLLRIVKLVSNVSTVLGTISVVDYANLSSDSFDSVFQNLRVQIYDEDESVKIEAKFNDEADPVLSVTDNSYPQFHAAGQFGVIFDDNDTEGHVTLSSIAIQAVQAVQGDNSVQPRQWTFGRIVDHAVALSTRDSNSKINREEFKTMVNASIQEMYEHCKRPRWAEDIITFKVKTGVQDYELPADVVHYDDVLHDTVQQNTIDIVPAAKFRRNVTTTSSGTPYEAYERGVGINGGPVLRMHPNPSEARTYTLKVSKSPRYLEDDQEIPDVPQNLCHWLSWGAIFLYSSRDSDRTHIRMAGQRWGQGLKAARIQTRMAAASGKFTITTGLGRRNRNDYEQSRYGLRR